MERAFNRPPAWADSFITAICTLIGRLFSSSAGTQASGRRSLVARMADGQLRRPGAGRFLPGRPNHSCDFLLFPPFTFPWRPRAWSNSAVCQPLSSNRFRTLAYASPGLRRHGRQKSVNVALQACHSPWRPSIAPPEGREGAALYLRRKSQRGHSRLSCAQGKGRRRNKEHLAASKEPGAVHTKDRGAPRQA